MPKITSTLISYSNCRLWALHRQRQVILSSFQRYHELLVEGLSTRFYHVTEPGFDLAGDWIYCQVQGLVVKGVQEANSSAWLWLCVFGISHGHTLKFWLEPLNTHLKVACFGGLVYEICQNKHIKKQTKTKINTSKIPVSSFFRSRISAFCSFTLHELIF